MTKKNGSKKRDRRNLRRLQENLATIFIQEDFKESSYEPEPDNLSETKDSTGEADIIEKERKKDIGPIKVFYLLKKSS